MASCFISHREFVHTKICWSKNRSRRQAWPLGGLRFFEPPGIVRGSTTLSWEAT